MELRTRLEAALRDHYAIERELGGGGMSRVFLAMERQLERRVVIKVLAEDVAALLSTTRFEREIRLAASLQQANIVPVLTAGVVDDVPYYTMPFVEGESLRARLAAGPLPEAQVIQVLRDVTRALAYAHERSVIHRDIKPDNILLSGDAAVVTDFGIAKAITEARATPQPNATGLLTQAGTAIGTPAYMAPEQAAADPAMDHRADLYALGCTAYELLTGRPPFADLPPHKLLAAHLMESPPAVASLRPGMDPRWPRSSPPAWRKTRRIARPRRAPCCSRSRPLAAVRPGRRSRMYSGPASAPCPWPWPNGARPSVPRGFWPKRPW